MVEYISLIYNSIYIRIFVGGLILYLAHVLFLIDKIKKKSEKYREQQYTELSKKYKGTVFSTKVFVELYELAREYRIEYETIKDNIKVNVWGGIIFLAGCLWGFVSLTTDLREDLSLVFIFIGSVLFFITLFKLIYWYVRK